MRSAVFCAVTLGLIGVSRVVFLGLDVAVTLGFSFQAVASKLCFRDKSQPNGDFGGWECAQNVPKPF